jgi:virginiamycin B lyase
LNRTLALFVGALLAALFAGCGPTTPITSGTPTPLPSFSPKVSNEYNVPTAVSSPAGITRSSNGLIFAEENGNKIGELSGSTSVTITEYTIPSTPAPKPLSVTEGSDGNFWFTESAKPQIGRLSTAGVFTEFALPNSASTPWGIATGPDGALWITDPGTNGLWQITTSGGCAFFSLKTAGADPTSITAGPNGAMWFIEANANQIGEMPVPNSTPTPMPTASPAPVASCPTLSTQPFEFPVTAGAGLGVIVEGADNALWFTETKADKIGRMLTTGALTSETTLTGLKTPFGLTLGGDSNFYIGDAGGNQIGQYFPSSGTTKTFPIPTASSGVYALAIGPDNEVYFTEQTANKVGQFLYFRP